MSWRHRPERPGATAYGSHYWGEWDACMRKWWLSKRAPHPSGGAGLAPFGTDRNLLVGRLFHEAVANYYLSGYRTGDYSLEAVAKTVDEAQAYSSEWNDDSAFDDDCALIRRMLSDYDLATGPGSQNPDFPSFKIATDLSGAPCIEYDFTMDLGNGTLFTARVDGIVEYAGSLYGLEHKTTGSAYFAKDLRASLHLALQVAGQCMVLNSPEAQAVLGRPVAGVVLNLFPKRRAKADPPYIRDIVTYTRLQLAKVRADLVQRQWLQDLLNDRYDALVSQGMDPWEAGALIFPANGAQTGTCYKYNRHCDHYGVCRAIGLEEGVSAGYNAATRAPEPTEE